MFREILFILRPCVNSGFRREVDENCSSGLLSNEQWQFLTDDSVQPIGPNFKTRRKEFTITRFLTTQKSAAPIFRSSTAVKYEHKQS